MIRLHNADTIRRLDVWCEQTLAIPSLLLMEHAALACREILRHSLQGGPKRILVVCGGGNNGGDGLALARLLCVDGHDVVIVASMNANMTAASSLNAAMARTHAPVCEPNEADEVFVQPWDCIIDAIIGVGGILPLRADVSRLCRKMNDAPGLKVAIDVPTGLDAETGHADPDVFRANATITLAAHKPGLYRRMGPTVCGTIHQGSIGVAQSQVDAFALPLSILEEKDLPALLPTRLERSSKHDFGRVLIVGGSRSMPGAPSLAAHAALSSGAGIVEVAAPLIHPATPREVMPTVLTASIDGTLGRQALEPLLSRSKRADVVVIGPGMTRSPETRDLILDFLHATTVRRIVIDADALSACNDLPSDKTLILTPHIREFAAMTGHELEAVADDAIGEATSFAASSSCILHLKHFPSITTDGRQGYLLPAYNAGLAKAGTGDVLAGIVGALWASSNGESPLEVAAVAAFVHARAGDIARSKLGARSMMAHDVIDALADVLR